jgi:predicted ATPase
MSHPFGNLLLQFRARKPGLSQTRLAHLAGYDPAVLARMCAGKKDLTGPTGRDRVVRVIEVLHEEGALATLDEANTLLAAGDMPPLYDGLPVEAALIRSLRVSDGAAAHKMPTTRATKSAPRHNLPAQLTSFIGREREITQVAEVLTQARLVTLTGAGGVGKTRLAIEAATRVVERFADGAWFVDLAPLADPLADPALVPQAVGVALGAREEPGRPMLATLVDHLRDRELLLLLDNCEHLIEAVAQLCDALLRDCHAVRILATSRQRLGITGEGTWRVPMLQTPQAPEAHGHGPMGLAELAHIEAVRLFVERATLASPAFTLTAHTAGAVCQIVTRLDGMPLAIELAAARITMLSVEDVAARLDDRFRLLTGGSRTALPRQQTLRGAIDWSYDLLTEPERILFRRLAVFAGGWTLAAAEAVCAGEGIEPGDVLDVLAHLVDQSLVIAVTSAAGVAGLTRFGMLETLARVCLGAP